MISTNSENSSNTTSTIGLALPSYVIITPVRDEGVYIEETIKSVINQSILPIDWIIVDDGSSDNTGQIIDDYAERYGWITAIHRENRGFRKAGSGVMEAFYAGYDLLKSKDYEYIIKLDGDLRFEPTYFEDCFKQFKNNPKLGIGGGIIYSLVNGEMQFEKSPKFHVRGATKIYRRCCWDAIDGLFKVTGWDTLDEVKANMFGWETRSFSNIKLYQLRKTGASAGTWRDLVKNGRANYISGYHPAFMTIKCIKRLFHRPFIIGSIALLHGFIGSFLKKIPQVEDDRLIKYLRKQQAKRLLNRKSIWK